MIIIRKHVPSYKHSAFVYTYTGELTRKCTLRPVRTPMEHTVPKYQHFVFRVFFFLSLILWVVSNFFLLLLLLEHIYLFVILLFYLLNIINSHSPRDGKEWGECVRNDRGYRAELHVIKHIGLNYISGLSILNVSISFCILLFMRTDHKFEKENKNCVRVFVTERQRRREGSNEKKTCM